MTVASCHITLSCLIIVSSSAPEAQRETVFVCAACNSSLIKLQWDGMWISSPSGQLEVIHCSTPSSKLLKPEHMPWFSSKGTSVCQDISCVELQDPPPMSLPVASLLSYSCCLWDFYCNMFNISCFNSQWRTGPKESVRLSTEHNGSKIKGPFSPLLSRGRCKACRDGGQDLTGGLGWYR